MAGKIKKLLENELVGGTHTTDVYPVTSTKAVYDENNERLDNIINKLDNIINKIEPGIIYDVSANNDGAVFESLQALLSSSSLNTLIPASVRCGGMSIRFIQGSVPNSDNKYVQFRLMAQSFSTTESDWQGVDDEPIVGSDNLVKSGGVAGVLYGKDVDKSEISGYGYFLADGKYQDLGSWAAAKSATALTTISNKYRIKVTVNKNIGIVFYNSNDEIVEHVAPFTGDEMANQEYEFVAKYPKVGFSTWIESGTYQFEITDITNTIEEDITLLSRDIDFLSENLEGIEEAKEKTEIAGYGYFLYNGKYQDLGSWAAAKSATANTAIGKLYKIKVKANKNFGIVFYNEQNTIVDVVAPFTGEDILNQEYLFRAKYTKVGFSSWIESPGYDFEIDEITGYAIDKNFDRIYEELDKHDSEINEISGIVTTTVINVGKNQAFTTLYDAIEFVKTKVNKKNLYVLQLWSDEIYYDDLHLHVNDITFDSASEQINYSIATILPYVTLKGMNGIRTIGLILNSISQYGTENIETLRVQGGATLENIKVVCKNVRYPVHCESTGCVEQEDMEIHCLNCEFEHLGNVANSGWNSTEAWGSGLSQGMSVHFEGCKFIAPFRLVYFHQWGGERKNTIYVKNCSFLNTGDMQAGQEFSSIYTLPMNNKNIDVIIDGMSTNADVEVEHGQDVITLGSYQGHSISPHLFVNKTSGVSLRFVSKTVGIGSNVSLVSTNVPTLLTNSISVIGETGKKAYLTGVCNLNVSHNNLSSILGDCSQTTKNIILNVDGTQREIVFDANYSSMSNADILSVIATKVSTYADVYLKNPYEEYYEELSDVLYRGLTDNAIEKGLLVSYNGMKLSVCTNNQDVYGLSIDEALAVNTVVRCIRKNHLSKNDQFAPQFESGSDSFVAGDLFDCSNNGKLLKNNSSSNPIAKAINTERIQMLF